jgi:uncharacterized damage-inducible protein DinB
VAAFDALLNEFREEVATTRRVLDRVPEDKLRWKPHPRSMSLGQLAWHIAVVPGNLARITSQDTFDVSQGSFVPPDDKSLAETKSAFESSVHDAEECLQALTEERARQTWKLMRANRELLSMTRLGVIRSIMLNHWYHHRGQMSVYLRLLNVPLPIIYGPNADENPFG